MSVWPKIRYLAAARFPQNISCIAQAALEPHANVATVAPAVAAAADAPVAAAFCTALYFESAAAFSVVFVVAGAGNAVGSFALSVDTVWGRFLVAAAAAAAPSAAPAVFAQPLQNRH